MVADAMRAIPERTRGLSHCRGNDSKKAVVFLSLAMRSSSGCGPSLGWHFMDVRVVDHPLAKARLSTMRDARTDNAAFRAALQELTLMLIYEATRDAEVGESSIHTPVAKTLGYRLANPPLLVPELRAALGMADQAHRLIPEAQM